MPGFTILASSTEIGDGVNTSGVEPNSSGGIKTRAEIDSIAAVAVQQRGVLTIELYVLLAKDIDGDFGSIFGSGKLADHFDIVEVNRGGHVKGSTLGLLVVRLEIEPGERF